MKISIDQPFQRMCGKVANSHSEVGIERLHLVNFEPDPFHSFSHWRTRSNSVARRWNLVVSEYSAEENRCSLESTVEIIRREEGQRAQSRFSRATFCQSTRDGSRFLHGRVTEGENKLYGFQFSCTRTNSALEVSSSLDWRESPFGTYVSIYRSVGNGALSTSTIVHRHRRRSKSPHVGLRLIWWWSKKELVSDFSRSSLRLQ